MVEYLLSFVSSLLGSLIGVFFGAYLSYRYGRKLHVLNERVKAYRMLWKLLPSEEYIESCYESDKKNLRNISGSLSELANYNSRLAKRVKELNDNIKAQIIEQGYDVILGRDLYNKVRVFVAETGGWRQERFREKILGRKPKDVWNIDEIYRFLLDFTKDIRDTIKNELFREEGLFP